MDIILIYVPTNKKTEAEIEEFYSILDEIMEITKKGKITMVMGDFNMKLRHGSESERVGTHGLGERNSRGNRLLQFCLKNRLCTTNTFFSITDGCIRGDHPWTGKMKL